MGDVLKLLLAIVLVGAGAAAYLSYNFEQNEEFRPYKGLTDTALHDLAEAYDAQMEQLDGRYKQLSDRKVEVSSHPLIGEQLQEFERVQRIADQKRKAGYQVSYVQADQKNLERELYIRAHPIQYFWDTATTF